MPSLHLVCESDLKGSAGPLCVYRLSSPDLQIMAPPIRAAVRSSMALLTIIQFQPYPAQPTSEPPLNAVGSHLQTFL